VALAARRGRGLGLLGESHELRRSFRSREGTGTPVSRPRLPPPYLCRGPPPRRVVQMSSSCVLEGAMTGTVSSVYPPPGVPVIEARHASALESRTVSRRRESSSAASLLAWGEMVPWRV